MANSQNFNMKKLIYLNIFLFASQILMAQQYPLFTNYMLNDYGFNPAIAGCNNYWDARAIYRSQWTGIEGAPKTQIVSLHGPVDSLRRIGVGGYFFNDSAGKLKRTGGTATVSYGIELPGLGQLRAGLGLNAFRFSLNNPDQSTIGTIDPLLADGMATTVTDLSAGLLFHLHNGIYLGISAPQILNRKLDLTDDEAPNRELIPHYYLMAGYRRQVNEKLALEPAILVKYTDAAPVQFDFSLRAFLNQKFWIGGTFRKDAAATGMVGYEVSPAITLAYAYDLTTNDLKEASASSHEITLGFKFGLPKDSDGDGIRDKYDKCPDVPGVKELDGCPEETVAEEDNDRDKDGILNPDDLCPDEAGPLSNKGCPLDGDRDQDGLADKIDKCPDIYGVASNAGCPADDRDQDGIVDAKDNCPDVAGPPSTSGCPENDLDGDLVANQFDKCPNTPGEIANDGCPSASDEEKAILDLAIQNLYFDTNRAKIKPESYHFLDKLAELLVERDDYKVKIEGHTDSRGSDAFNYELSKNRADSVRDYLVRRGVSARQLTVEYYGERRPVASNVSEATRRLNRRVEMSFIWD